MYSFFLFPRRNESGPLHRAQYASCYDTSMFCQCSRSFFGASTPGQTGRRAWQTRQLQPTLRCLQQLLPLCALLRRLLDGAARLPGVHWWLHWPRLLWLLPLSPSQSVPAKEECMLVTLRQPKRTRICCHPRSQCHLLHVTAQFYPGDYILGEVWHLDVGSSQPGPVVLGL